MASIDEAYLDMTGTERLLGPPLKSAHALHQFMKSETKLNCSIGIGTSRLIAKVCSDQAKPNGVLWIVPGQEASFLAPLSVRKIPGVGKVMEQKLNEIGIKKVGDLAKLDDTFLRERFGEWGMALAGKSRGLDAGGYFDREVAEEEGPKSVSHEHTFNNDTRDQEKLEAMLARLSEMVCRRLREQELHTRTVQIKLRYSDFSTITRAHSLDQPTQLDTVVAEIARRLFRENWDRTRTVRLLGVQTSGFEDVPVQLDLLRQVQDDKVSKALTVADQMRDRFGENAVSLATGLKSRFREKTHENPASLPGKSKKKT
jgi:DNA polymerase-4